MQDAVNACTQEEITKRLYEFPHASVSVGWLIINSSTEWLYAGARLICSVYLERKEGRYYEWIVNGWDVKLLIHYSHTGVGQIGMWAPIMGNPFAGVDGGLEFSFAPLFFPFFGFCLIMPNDSSLLTRKQTWRTWSDGVAFSVGARGGKEIHNHHVVVKAKGKGTIITMMKAVGGNGETLTWSLRIEDVNSMISATKGCL